MRRWLIQLRKSKKLTQEQVANGSYIERAYYTQIERGTRTPSINVAKNIAKVLKFDPLQFFENDFEVSNKENSIRDITRDKSPLWDIYTHFKNLERGQIVYLYNNIENYNEHVFDYLLASIDTNRHCFVIDNKENFIGLHQKLESIHTKEELEKYVHCFCLETSDKISQDNKLNNFKGVKYQLRGKPISIWMHYERSINKTISSEFENMGVDEKNTLFVQAYNASSITAGEHIKMMKKYPLMMIDEQIVYSPFFNTEKSLILPSLYLQEDL